MKKAIAIGILGIGLISTGAAAQTVAEQATILREFQRTVVDYSDRHSLGVMHESTAVASPMPKIFTLPVAVVFRQMIAKAIAAPHGDLADVLQHALPALPNSLKYALIDHDLVLRDADSQLVVAVLRNAVAPNVAVKR